VLLVDWLQKITIGNRTDEENSVRVSLEEEVVNVSLDMAVDASRECNEEEMISQLKKMNAYLSIITGITL